MKLKPIHQKKLKRSLKKFKNDFKGGYVLENNHQGERTKFLTIAGKIVDSHF